MSTLDRAFIKVYAHAPAQAPRVSAPHPAGLHGPHTPPREMRRQLGPVADHVASMADAPEMAAVPPPIVPPAHISLKAPLSSFATPAPAASELHAGVEIEKLDWPDEISQLLKRAERALDKFADLLVARMADSERCLAMTSCLPGEGSSTVALAVARHLGARGMQVAVVDAQFANPTMARRCHVAAEQGWTEAVDGQCPLSDALVASTREGVTLVPCLGETHVLHRPTDSARLAAVFDALRQSFDIILLDASPIVDAEAAQSLAALAAAIHLDACYLVRDARSTSAETLSHVCALLRQAGTSVAGIIDNFVAPASLDESPGKFKLPKFAGRLLDARAR